jgi:hypothetical protein
MNEEQVRNFIDEYGTIEDDKWNINIEFLIDKLKEIGFIK